MAGAPPEGLVDTLHLLDSANLTVRPLFYVKYMNFNHKYHVHTIYYHVQVPDELTKNLLSRSGAVCSDDRTVRLVSLAAQKFLTDVIEEAKIAQGNRSQAPLAVQKAEGFARQQDKEKDRRAALLTEDLTKALQQVGFICYFLCWEDKIQVLDTLYN